MALRSHHSSTRFEIDNENFETSVPSCVFHLYWLFSYNYIFSLFKEEYFYDQKRPSHEKNGNEMNIDNWQEKEINLPFISPSMRDVE